jgi:hypothetical protein
VYHSQLMQRHSDQTMSRAALLVPLSLYLSVGSPGDLKLAKNSGLESQSFNATPGSCPIIRDAVSRMHCNEGFGLNVAQTGAQAGPTADDAWRLLRTSDPAGGRDVVSIMRIADVSKSDREFAGLMLRCSEGSMQVLVVLFRVLPPRAHPKVRLAAGSSSVELTASVVPPDVSLLLPDDATALATGAWLAATELVVTVGDEQGTIRGVIPLLGFGRALALLRSNCRAR